MVDAINSGHREVHLQRDALARFYYRRRLRMQLALSWLSSRDPRFPLASKCFTCYYRLDLRCCY